MGALERHEAASHAIPSRQVRDLGHAVVLYDPRDPEPFWNRLQAVRWPEDDAGFDRRLTEVLAIFLALGRTPHVWPSPVHGSPHDLVDRLVNEGFTDVGAGHVMVLDDEAACGPVAPSELRRGVTLEVIGRPGGGMTPGVPADPEVLAGAHAMAAILVDAFGTPAERHPELALDLARTVDDPRIALALVRVDGEPAACAKATTFDGFTYLSSVGTRDGFRGRGLAGLATRHALAASRGRQRTVTYLGVFSGNEPALTLYERLGFASVGESPDLLLE